MVIQKFLPIFAIMMKGLLITKLKQGYSFVIYDDIITINNIHNYTVVIANEIILNGLITMLGSSKNCKTDIIKFLKINKVLFKSVDNVITIIDSDIKVYDIKDNIIEFYNSDTDFNRTKLAKHLNVTVQYIRKVIRNYNENLKPRLFI